MDINQIIAQASKPHVDAIDKALADLKVAADGAKAAGFSVKLLPQKVKGPEGAAVPDPIADTYFTAVAGRILKDETNVELTYSVSIVSKEPEVPAPEPTVQPTAA